MRVLIPLIFAALGLGAASAASASWPNGAKAAVVLSYDDALQSQLDHALPALEQAGIKGTFFLSNVRQDDVGRWRAAAVRGHELANHTMTHPCLAGTFEMPARQQLEQHTPDSVLQDVAQQNLLLSALDDRLDHGFAVPCGQTLAGGQDYLEPLRHSGMVSYARSVEASPSDLSQSAAGFDLFRLPGRSFSGPDATAGMVAYAEQAAAGGGVAIYVFHGIGGDHLSVGADDHRRLVAWLAERRQVYWITTMRELAAWIAKSKAEAAAKAKR